MPTSNMARVTLLVCILLISAVYGTTKTDYLAQRQDFINAERHQGLGGDVKFTPKEAAVNTKLVQLKSDEIKKYRDQGNGEYFPPVNNFMKSRSNISQSEVYQIIRAMPKGKCHFSFFFVVAISLVTGQNQIYVRQVSPIIHVKYKRELKDFIDAFAKWNRHIVVA